MTIAFRPRLRGLSRAVPAVAVAAASCLALSAVAVPAPAHAAAPAATADRPAPIAGAFVYPVGDELDYSKPCPGEAAGFYVSSEYLDRRGRKHKRIHRGVDLANGRGGAEVRSVASGVVVVADANARIKVNRRQKVKVPVVVDGKRTTKTVTKTRATWKWRTGWGNYVVIRHELPGGASIYSLYGHLAPKSVAVKKGDVVSAGQMIGKVGRTGRASSSHLHLEIRKSMPADGVDENLESSDEPPAPEERAFVSLATLDPIPFLNEHVRSFRDLEPGSWQARYATAAARDGVLTGDRNRFEPNDAITRADFYRALVSAFGLAAPFTQASFGSSIDALVSLGILDETTAKEQRAGDTVRQADALELILRCLDHGGTRARARSLASIEPLALASDFLRQFAGNDVADHALKEAKAAVEPAAQRKPRRASARKPSPAIPDLDPGLAALARSTESLTRAESCLLFASATRLGVQSVSAGARPSAPTPPAAPAPKVAKSG